MSASKEFVDTCEHEMRLLQAECSIKRCEFDPGTHIFSYLATSRHFDHVPAGAAVPEYEARFESSDGGVRFTGFYRVEEHMGS